MANYILCSKCTTPIRSERVVTCGLPPDDVICGKCMKEEYGESFYHMVKNMIDNQPERSKREDARDSDAVL